MDNDEEKFVERSRALFDASVERLDARTRSRLTQARHAALDELRSGAARRWRWVWAPASGLATAVVLALVLRATLAPDPISEAPPLEELDLVANGAELELLEEVEFYAWLAQQRGAEGDG